MRRTRCLQSVTFFFGPLARGADARYTARGMSNSAIELRRKRLAFRAARRGFKEADAIFGTFAAMHLGALNTTELDAFEALLDVPDHFVYDWLRGYAPVPTMHDTKVFLHLKAICCRKNPVWNV